MEPGDILCNPTGGCARGAGRDSLAGRMWLRCRNTAGLLTARVGSGNVVCPKKAQFATPGPLNASARGYHCRARP